jgi:hypothetical protein
MKKIAESSAAKHHQAKKKSIGVASLKSMAKSSNIIGAAGGEMANDRRRNGEGEKSTKYQRQ